MESDCKDLDVIKIIDEDIDQKTVLVEKWKERKASRGIVIRDDKKIAVFNKVSKNEFKLPGGGMENDETPEETFIREVLEETGCQIEIIELLCITKEYRSQKEAKQTSYVYIGKVIEDTKKLNLTEKERCENAQLLWVEPEEALKLVEDCFEKVKPSNYDSSEDVYMTKFVVKRDSMILRKYLLEKM